MQRRHSVNQMAVRVDSHQRSRVTMRWQADGAVRAAASLSCNAPVACAAWRRARHGALLCVDQHKVALCRDVDGIAGERKQDRARSADSSGYRAL